MKFHLYKANCKLCFKSFTVPVVKNGFTILYYFREINSFSFFKWDEDSKIKKIVSDIIDSNVNVQILNDNSKGGTFKQMIALMADGKCELVDDNYRCPRCKFRFVNISAEEKGTIDLDTLTFNNFLSNSKIELTKLLEKLK